MNTAKNNAYFHWIIALIAVLAVCAACYFCFNPQSKKEADVVSTVKKESKIITVFIHGSICPDNSFIDTISLSDLNTIFFDTIEEDSEYMKSLKRVRVSQEICKDQIMLGEGLQEVIENDINYLCALEDAKGCHKSERHHCARCHRPVHAQKDSIQEFQVAHYAIACYHKLMKRLFPKYETAYYTFGHLGVLSHRYRENIAKNLYVELLAKVLEAQDVYETVKLVLVTHSHGGTIALNMAKVEDELKKGLVIDDLVLFGTPLQHETAPHAYHPMFKRVLNCYSLGDTVQGLDILTTASRKCYKTFSSIETLDARKNRVYDIQLVVNDDGHAITHNNMWYIKLRDKITSHLDPLPYAVMAPALLAALNEQTFGPIMQASIRSQNGHFGVEVVDMEKKAQYKSPNTYEAITVLRDQIIAQLMVEQAAALMQT